MARGQNGLLPITGLLGGAVGGYLSRPDMVFVGKLPLSMVVSRGIFLDHFDKVYLPVAQASFDHMATCAFLGLILGAAVAFAAGTRKGR
jgi:hypothetical protein